MAEYHVKCGMSGIYAGVLESKGKTCWKDKSDCTDEAVSAAAQYLLENKRSFRFKYGEKRYRLAVTEVTDKP